MSYLLGEMIKSKNFLSSILLLKVGSGSTVFTYFFNYVVLVYLYLLYNAYFINVILLLSPIFCYAILAIYAAVNDF